MILDKETKSILKDIVKELKKINELKALEMKFPKIIQSAKEIDKILKQ